MPTRLIARREALAWAGCFLLVAAALVAVRFTSSDPDSDLYAGLSARLADEPLWRWVAPEWWGLWPRIGMTGYFMEHPVGGLLLPAALTRLGVPGGQSAYIVGAGMGLASILLIASLIARLSSREAGRAALVLLQIMPVAFLFRIRANHEYVMLVCLLITLIGLERARRSWWGFALVAGGLTAALLVKGVFVVLTLAGAAVWILVNPTREPGSPARPVLAVVMGLVTLAAVVAFYDAWFRHVTAESYWGAYWERQLGQVDVATPVGGGLMTLLEHAGFYLSRLLWHAAPWTLALAAVALTRSMMRPWRSRSMSDREWRGLLFVLIYTAMLIAALSPSSRVAERYIFSGTYAIAAAGIVASVRSWSRLSTGFARLDQRIPALPALVWLTLMAARLAAGPWIPRI